MLAQEFSQTRCHFLFSVTIAVIGEQGEQHAGTRYNAGVLLLGVITPETLFPAELGNAHLSHVTRYSKATIQSIYSNQLGM